MRFGGPGGRKSSSVRTGEAQNISTVRSESKERLERPGSMVSSQSYSRDNEYERRIETEAKMEEQEHVVTMVSAEAAERACGAYTGSKPKTAYHSPPNLKS